jgi:hypothetical protein
MDNQASNRGRSSLPSVTADTTISVKLTDSATTYTVVASSKLSEDYIHSSSMLASASATSPLASFLNSSGQSEALLIHDNGELCHLLREPLSGTGWNVVGIGAQIETIIGASSNSMATVGVDESIWISNAGHWNSVPPPPGKTPAFSACQEGTFFATSSHDGQSVLYQYDPTSAAFREVGPIPYSTPPVGRVGYLWTVGVGGMVLYNKTSPMDPSNWFPLSYGAWERRGDIPGAVFVTTDNSVWVFCPVTKALYTRDPYDIWYHCSAPDRVIAVAPLNGNAFYALCVHEETTRLYLCDGQGNNTVVSQPEDDKTLKSISVGAMDGTLWVLDNIGTAWRNLNGTWVRMIQPTDLAGVTRGHHVTEVVTGQHKLGDQYAFYVIEGNLHWSVFGESEGLFGGYWTVPVKIFSGISNIRAVNDPHANSKLIVYGVSAKGNLVVVQSVSKNDWTAVEKPMDTSLSGTKPIFNPWNSYWITYAVIHDVLYAGVGKLDQPAKTLSTVKDLPIFLKSLIPFSTSPQGIDWTLAAAAVDASNQVWTIQISSVDQKGNITHICTPLGAPATGAIPNAVGMIASETAGARIYACDQDDLLWVIRQTGFSNAAFQWSAWLPLGDECTTLAVGCTLPPPSAPHKPPVDLFSLDPGFEVNVLSEDATTGQLSDLVMLKPAGTNTTPEYVSRYLTEVTVTDPNGTPQPNFQIAVTSDVAVGVWVGQTIYTITPNRPTPLITGPSGTFTFAFFASDLNTPTFFFNADTLVSEASIYPAQEVQDYLSGKPNVMPGRPDFDSGGKTLLDAQMQTVPNFQARGGTVPFVNGPTATKNAPTAAKTITQVFAIPVSPSGTSGQWSLGGNSSGGLVGGSSIWHDLCKFPHDIEHAIKKEALKVSHMAVDVEKKVVHVTMELANGLTQVLDLLIHTVEDVVSAVKCAFRYVERAVEEAIDWLKALFNWHDILNTKNIIEASLNGTMTKLADALNPKSPNSIEAIINRAFSDAEAKITAAFAEAARYFGPNDSFQSTTDSVPYPSGATPIGNNPLNPNALNSAQASNGSHTNYVQTHTNNYVNQGGTFPPVTSGGGVNTDNTFQSLTDTVAQNTGSGTSYQTDNARYLSSLQSVFASRQSFVDTIMLDLINAAKDVVVDVLKFVDKIIQKLLSLAFDAFVGFQDMLTTGIDIPVISWIWKQISDHSLTMLDLLSLALAVPATLLYKLTFGMPKAKAPFTDDQAQQIVAALNNPQTFPWPILGRGTVPVSASPFTPEIISLMHKLLITPTGVIFSIFDCLNDSAGWSKLHGEELPPNFGRFAAAEKIAGGLLFRFALTPTAVLQGTPISTEMDIWTLSNWSMGFLPLIALLGFAIRPVTNPELKGIGMAVANLIGYAQLGVGVATIVEQAKLGSKVPFIIARNIIAPFPNIVKGFLLVPGEPEATACLFGVWFVNALCDISVGSLTLLADMT